MLRSSSASPGPATSPARFLLLHGLLLPGLLALTATWLHLSGWDMRLSAAWFDPASGGFPIRQWRWLELLGHRTAKSVVLALWGLLLAAAVASRWWPALRPHRRTLWLTVAAMALGPAVVAGLKDINTMACPWDLTAFGGSAPYRFEWFVSREAAGRCFPGGHAAGGFSLIALCFAGRLCGNPRLERLGLLAALLVGALFGFVRLVQGAHFASHNLWSAAIDWWLALACFAPSLLTMRSAPSVAAQASSCAHSRA